MVDAHKHFIGHPLNVPFPRTLKNLWPEPNRDRIAPLDCGCVLNGHANVFAEVGSSRLRPQFNKF